MRSLESTAPASKNRGSARCAASRRGTSKKSRKSIPESTLCGMHMATGRRRIPLFWPHPAAKQRRNRQSKAHGVQTSVSGTRTRGTGTAFGAQQPRGFSSTRSALSIHLSGHREASDPAVLNPSGSRTTSDLTVLGAWRPSVGLRCPHARHGDRFQCPATSRFLVDPKPSVDPFV